MTGGIYKITNMITGKIYIGKKPINSRKVMIDDNIFESIKDAAKFLNISYGALFARIKRGKAPEVRFI